MRDEWAVEQKRAVTIISPTLVLCVMWLSVAWEIQMMGWIFFDFLQQLSRMDLFIFAFRRGGHLIAIIPHTFISLSNK